MKNSLKGVLRICFFVAVFLSLFFSKPPSAVHAQLVPTIPAVNGLIPSTVNGIIPTVTTLLNGAVPTTTQIINPGNSTSPTPLQTTNTTSSQESGGTSYYSTTSTYNSQASPQNPSTKSSVGNNSGNASVLILNRKNTESGEIVLNKDINEVVFGPDSLIKNRPPLIFIMPSEKDIPILFNFQSFLATDLNGAQHVLLPQAIQMKQTSGNDSVYAAIAENTDITTTMSTCSGDIWDGKLTALVIQTSSDIAIPNKNIGTPIEIGRNDCPLKLSRQANIFFTNRANSQVGYRLQNQGNFTKITTLCPMKSQTECYTNEGKNLTLKTYHFTQFVTFTDQDPLEIITSLLKNTNALALLFAIVVTLLIVLALGNFSVLKKVGKIVDINKQKDEYVSVASHELRSPMTAIKWFVSAILNGTYGKVQNSLKEPLKQVEKSTQSSIDLVNDILDVSKIEAGKITFSPTTFSIDSAISEVVTTLEPTATSKNITLQTKEITTTECFADKDKVRRLLTNLISNAIKYTDHGGVVVTTKENKDTVTVLIKDTGKGILDEEKKKLFKKFERMDTQKEGTGLGLYISKQLAQKMGGDIWLEASREGYGSTFALSLKKHQAKPKK